MPSTSRCVTTTATTCWPSSSTARSRAAPESGRTTRRSSGRSASRLTLTSGRSARSRRTRPAGFNWSGEIWLHTPGDGDRRAIRQAGLLAALPAHRRPGRANSYRISPELESMRVEARGGTVGRAPRRHGEQRDRSGVSDGSPGQRFTLRHTPILVARSGAGPPDRRAARQPSGALDGGRRLRQLRTPDEHYTLDPLDGTLTLGPSLLQPGGDGLSVRGGAAARQPTLLQPVPVRRRRRRQRAAGRRSPCSSPRYPTWRA